MALVYCVSLKTPPKQAITAKEWSEELIVELNSATSVVSIRLYAHVSERMQPYMANSLTDQLGGFEF